MQLTIDFLSAADKTPLTKTYSQINGQYEVSPYPFVKYFSSTREEVNSLHEFNTALMRHAAKGACLLKGMLIKQITDSSRAGLTNANEPTQYLLLDMDFEDGFDSVDEFIATLDPALTNVSYIFQHSSSAGITSKPGLRGHVIILLDKPALPSMIKQWLINRNLVVPGLKKLVTLSANSMSLKWPLDITTCQNDKLIYIANPNTIGFDDTLKEQRFNLVTKPLECATLNFETNATINQECSNELVNQLRHELGIKKRTAKYKQIGGESILTNPNIATVTGVQTNRGFTYLNVNGGDSWGYYYPEDKPDLLFNFKGEPIVRLQDFVPEYYATLFAETNQIENAIHALVFREPRTDQYFAGTYDSKLNEVDLNPIGSTQKIKHFLMNHGQDMPEAVEDWEMCFNPKSKEVINFRKQSVNTFKETPYMRKSMITTMAIPRSIDKVISSICVDEETKKHFLDWLAYSLKTREKLTTSWVFNGVQGTGKGILFTKILKPLFGANQVVECTTNILDENFNQYLETALILWIDEFNLRDSRNATGLMNKLKHLVTEDTQMIRGMRKNAVAREIFFNVIIATNHVDPVEIDENDRRFNIAPPQETPLVISDAEVNFIEEELTLFASYLLNRATNKTAVNTVLKNEARTRMITASETSVAAFFRALREGNLDFFLQYLQEKNPITPNNSYIDYQRCTKRWAANYGEATFVTNEELRGAYSYLQNTGSTPVKFGRMMKIHRLNTEVAKINGAPKRGLWITFRNADLAEIHALTHEPNISSISR